MSRLFPETWKACMRLKNPINIMKDEWKQKTPKGKWRVIYDIGSYTSSVLQLNLYTTCKVGWLGYFTTFSTCAYITLLIYSVYYYTIRGRYQESLPSFGILGLILSGFTSQVTCVNKDRFKWKQLINFAGNEIYRDDSTPSTYNHVCSESMTKSMRRYVQVLSLQALSLGIAMIGPVYGQLQGLKVTFFNVRWPFIHNNPELEYLINLAWGFLSGTYEIVGFCTMEAKIIIVNDTVKVTSDLCACDLNQLSHDIEYGNEKPIQIGMKLKTIFMKMHRIDRYIQEFRDVMYWRLFLSPPSITFSVAISIFTQYTMNNLAGYGLALISYVQMVVMCYTGQNVVDRNEKLAKELYNFKWSLLPISAQKDVMRMIVRLQNGVVLTMGPFEQLNFDALKVLTQKVYSFLTFLIKLKA